MQRMDQWRAVTGGQPPACSGETHQYAELQQRNEGRQAGVAATLALQGR